MIRCFFSINNENGETLWSCLDDNKEKCSMMLSETNSDLILSDLKGGEKLETASFTIEDNTSGLKTEIEIASLPIGIYSGNDRYFLFETYKMLLLSMVISILASAVSSIFLSRSLSRPLLSLAQYSTRMASHDYSAYDSFKHGTREVDDLHSAIQQLARSLEAQEELKKRLTADVAHELRTPLTTLQTHMEAMIDGIWDSNSERLNDCHMEIMRMTGLVSELDDLHSYDLQNKELNKESFNLVKSIESTLRLFTKDFKEREIHWRVFGTTDFICADEDKLKQIWINLISNSLKFLSLGGKINVTVKGDSPVEIVFRDSGAGIDSADLPKIFERCYKGDSGRNKKGSGLGLSIVKEIVDLHNGEITAESINMKGTKFTIILPGTIS